MKHWILSETEFEKSYIILTEKSVWLTSQDKNLDINKLIETKNLGIVKSIRYEDLKEIVFIDSNFSIEFRYKDDSVPEINLPIDKMIYSEIKSYLKNNLKGTELKNFSLFKQILPHLISFVILSLIIGLTYMSALEIESGNEVRVSGGKSFIITSIAKVLGSTATLIIGVIIISLLIYFISRKIQNPNRGEVLKIKKSPRLVA
ncbi:hypothetical protein UMM65_06310 [Aureibaculum sp. 2210JD6-5]|uniref:hypothetical protein n=1 Tax=Aureibaculum sp. 2210JD6-5 TaxID=3103957 RepID=UPI002AACDF2E|nr:hypothetical protein [Aureibaculum sp. 2210JD6-5]MDY7394847.1 hypothetical protein [Aureibaculum sp. 2210JD6-5]